MSWVLIIVFLHGGSGRPMVVYHDFDTLTACQEAGAKTSEMYASLEVRHGIKFTCTAKR
jgi:hypothetical protein